MILIARITDMKRRDFLKRLSAAATAFVVTPTAFRCFPAAAKVRAVVAPNVGAITPASIAYLTPEQLETLFRPRIILEDEALLVAEFEMKVLKPSPPLGLYDFIMSKNNFHNFLAAEGRNR